MEPESGERSNIGSSVVALVSLLCALLLPIGYVLSIGPASWLHNHGYLPDAAGIVYWPLEALCRYSTSCCDFLFWYLEFWE